MDTATGLRGLRSALAIAAAVAAASAGAFCSRADALAVDPAYGDSGIAEVALGPGATPAGIARSGADAVVAGSISDGSGGELFAVAKLGSTGTQDSGFGTGGVAATGVEGRADSVAVLSDGRIAVAGIHDGEVVVALLAPDGEPDEGFGTEGVARFDFLAAASATGRVDVSVDSQDRILVAGTAPAPVPAGLGDAYVARLDDSGGLDSDFSSDGIASGAAGPDSDDGVADAAALSDDSVCAVGTAAGIGGQIYCFDSGGNFAPGPPALSPLSDYEAVAALPTGGYVPFGTARDAGSTVTYWFSPAHHNLNFAQPLPGTGLQARARAVALLDPDFAVVAGSSNLGAGTRVVPAFVYISTYPDTGSLAKWKFPDEAPYEGAAVDASDDGAGRALALLELAADGGSAVSVARVSPSLFDPPDPPDPPDEPGKLILGDLRAPASIDGLLRRGATVAATCTVRCDLKLALEVPKRVARRLGLKSARLDAARAGLPADVRRRVSFEVGGRAASRLRRADGRTAGLRLRVVRKRVDFGDA